MTNAADKLQIFFAISILFFLCGIFWMYLFLKKQTTERKRKIRLNCCESKIFANVFVATYWDIIFESARINRWHRFQRWFAARVISINDDFATVFCLVQKSCLGSNKLRKKDGYLHWWFTAAVCSAWINRLDCYKRNIPVSDADFSFKLVLSFRKHCCFILNWWCEWTEIHRCYRRGKGKSFIQ